MRCWATILAGLLIMMGQHSRSEALFCYFRLEDGSEKSSGCAPSAYCAECVA
jgi:hypothetical protein